MANASDSNGKSSLEKFHDVIRRIEKERDSKIWCMVHQGRRSHICHPATHALYQGRPSTGTGKRLEILLHTGGGHPEIAYSVMKFFRRRFKEVNIIVPLIAKSAATLMCLGADHIFMGEFGELGPIDIRLDDHVKYGERGFSPLDEFKSLEFMREQAIEWMEYYAVVMNHQYGLSIQEALKDSVPLVSTLMRPMLEQIDPIEMGGYRRSLAIGEEYAKRMLALTGNSDAHRIVKKLVWEYPSHDFCIDFEEAEEIGLPVKLLSAAHDHQLSEAIIDLDKEHYHGFTPQLPATQKRKASRAVRQGPNAGGQVRRQVNGSNGGRSEERLTA